MQALDRRECLKNVLTGLTTLSVGGFALPALARQAEAQPQAKAGASGEEFWKQVDKTKASALAHSVVNAARAGVRAQREVNAATRAAALLGERAGKEHIARAEKEYQARTAQLQKAKQALAEFVHATGESEETKFKEFLDKGAVKEGLERARRSTVQSLLRSEISAEEAKTARKTLDERYEKAQGITSFHDLTAYLDHHVDELIAQKMSQEDPNAFCEFLLLITSIYVALLAVAIILFVLLLGLVPLDTLFNDLLASVCP